ncbi:MAG: hypothetical protein R3E39_10880 [Anaerolineae bacterium]
MLLFRAEEDVVQWCEQTNRPRGALLTLEQIWALSQAWYGNRMSPHFRGRSAAEAEQIFASLGLNDPFWRYYS